MKRLRKIIKKWFIYEPNVIKNLKEYAEKEKAEQQKP